jgi:phospholipid/cholesterol/gamma-HCH transport system substrate-binding protein
MRDSRGGSTPPYKLAGLATLVIVAIVFSALWAQFRGGFADPEKLTLIAARAGLLTDPGQR